MSKFGFNKIARKFGVVAKREIAKEVANHTRDYFVGNFFRQGFGNEHWAEVQRRTEGTRAYMQALRRDPSATTRPILIGQTRMLFRAVKNSIKQRDFKRIRLVVNGSQVPYAAIHNEGTDKMPQRKIMGHNKELKNIQLTIIKKKTDSIWPVK